jgi:predicted ester cyclase
MSNLILRNRKALVSQLYDYLNRYDFETAAALVLSRNTNDYLAHWQDVRKTFPDMSVEPLEMIADDERIVVRSLFSGTHRGIATLPHHGSLLVGAKATGRAVSVSQIHIYQVVASKLVELHVVRDDSSLYQQLKLLPNSLLEKLERVTEFGYPDLSLVAR